MRTTTAAAVLSLALGGAALAQPPVSVPMDAQINLGYTYNSQSPGGNAIYPAFNGDTQTFFPGSHVRHHMVAGGGWWYHYVDLNLAGITAPGDGLDLSAAGTKIEFDTRIYHDPSNTNRYADAPVFLRAYTYAADGNTYLGYRDYSIVYATQAPWNNPPYPTWTHVTIDVNADPHTDGGTFNVADVSRIRFYGTDWYGDGKDFADFKNLLITPGPMPSVLLSCSGEQAGDFYYRGFYVVQYPGVSLNTAEVTLSAAEAGSYVLALTVRSNTYDGPVLGASTNTVTLNGSTSERQPVTFAFPSPPIVKYSRVCFILSLLSGPGTAVYYSVPGLTGGCTTVVQTEGTTPPQSTFRRYGVNLILTGIHDPNSDLRLAIARQPTGPYLYWNSIQGRTYTLQTNHNLQLFNDLQTGIPATPPTNTFGPIVPLSATRQFYRVVLEPTPVP